MKITLQEKYQHLKPLVDNIEQYFEQSSHVLHKKRNEIRVISFENNEYVIKAFRIPNWVNRIAYRYFRPSKAKRSYEYSLKVGAELCPEAVAYAEEIKLGLLARSYYISLHFKCDFEIRALLNDMNFANRNQILRAFAVFTYQLHEKNILHRDYSPGNILVKKKDDHYTFKIVDVNRMQFKTLTLEERLSNFVRLSEDDETMKVIIYQYAECIQQPAEKLFQQTLQYRDTYLDKRALKNKLRGRS